MSLTVRSLTLRPVLVPIRRPPRSASGPIPQAPLVLIDLETEQGVVGRSYVFTFAAWALSPTVECLNAALEIVRGEPVAPAHLAARLRARLRLIDTPGLLGIALAGLDMAAWDALARAQKLSLTRLLGGVARAIPAYNSCGLWIRYVDGIADEASELLEEGNYRALKLRIGRADAREDRAAAEAVRERIGDDVALMSDYNQSLDTQQAIARGRGLEDLDLAWIEEPIAHDNYAGYAKICAALETPVQTGENLLDTRSMARAIALDSLDLVMPDVQRIGGVTGWMRAAAIADAHDVPMSSHLFPEFSRHLLAVTPTAHWLEYMDWANPLLEQPTVVRDGAVEVPDTPGAGLEWDEHAVRRYSV